MSAPSVPTAPSVPPAPRQVEVQLGHLCNNRCVFCVSGQLSEQKRAPQLPPAPIRRQLAEARKAGASRITFLGGEPTMQRSFFGLLAYAVELDFPEIVLFTNGTMTPRESFRQRVDEVLAGLGPDVQRRVIWRFSLQGGTQEAHDATTVNPGAWERIQQSLQVLRARGARLTGNMCVVESNYRSVAALAEIAERFGFEDLHLDMIRPRDAGDRTDAHLRSILARYSDLAPHLTDLSREVDRRLGPTFDLNFGNVPYCTAPEVTHRIHHDGQDTVTVAADGQGNTQEGFDKYADKRGDKRKLPTCATCAFDKVCSGVFDKYREFFGDAEFVPVAAEELWRRDTGGHHFALLAEPPLRRLEATGTLRILRVDERADEVEVALGAWHLGLRRAGRQSLRQASLGWFTLTTDRLAVAFLGPRPQEPKAIARLQTDLQLLAQALGSPPFEASAASQVDRAWQLRQQRREQELRLVAGLVQRLQGEPLAGLLPRGLKRAADGQGAELQYGDATGELLLRIEAQTLPDGTLRPRFRHEAKGLSDEVVARFNHALGQKLRQGHARPAA